MNHRDEAVRALDDEREAAASAGYKGVD